MKMKDKVCIITGFTSGIGLATAVSLAAKGATLGLVCRNKVKGENVLKFITEKTTNKNIDLFIADLSSQDEIRRVASEIIAKYPRIDVLINNAGAINPTRVLTVDGIETTFAVNHLAYFLLTHLLLDKLKAAPKARIISVASMAAMMGAINFDDLSLEKSFAPMKAYAQSKLANIMFTYELARRLEGTNITANCLHPGVVSTGFGLELKGVIKFGYKYFGKLFRTSEKGAETSIYLATAPEVENISGKYFKDKKESNSSKLSCNVAMQAKLWEVSEKMVKIA